MKNYSTRKVVAAATAALAILAVIIGSGFFLSWLGSREGSDSESTAPSVDSGQDQWSPLFVANPDRNAAIALARSIDGSFDLARLVAWSKKIPKFGATEQRHEVQFLIFNEVVERHRQADIAPLALGDALTQILGDPAINRILRDYSAQHLGLLAEEHSDLRPSAMVSFCEVLEDQANFQSELPGTVVNAGTTLRSKAGASLPHVGRFGQAVASLIGSPNLYSLVKVSLLQSASSETADLFLPVLRSLLDDPEAPEGIAIAAVGSLGRVGDKSDLALLRSVEARGTHASIAARTAIARIENPLVQNANPPKNSGRERK